MNDSAGGFLSVGIFLGVLITFGLLALFGTLGNDNFMNEHSGIRDLVSEMREECESQEGVVSCGWNEKELDFVPTSR
jgi:hypothetical protein